MGKKAEDFDAQISQIRNSYLFAAGVGNWSLASHFAVLMNKSVSPKNRVQYEDSTDLEPPEIIDHLHPTDDLRNWCFKYVPLIEDAISRERARMLVEYEVRG